MYVTFFFKAICYLLPCQYILTNHCNFSIQVWCSIIQVQIVFVAFYEGNLNNKISFSSYVSRCITLACSQLNHGRNWSPLATPRILMPSSLAL